MRIACILLIVTWMMRLSLSAQRTDEAGSAAAIRALEREWVQGQSRNDNRALNLIFDNVLVYVEYGRLVSKGEYLSRIRWEAPNLDEIVMERITVRAFGSTAIVVGTYREKQATGGPPGIRRRRFIDTWVYKQSGWVLVAAAATALAK